MRVLVQRVLEAQVKVDGEVKGKIKKGILCFVGFTKDDNEDKCRKLASKIRKLRIFEDQEGKTNLSSKEVNGEILVISQFTLYANCKKGNRPSFIEAGAPDKAEALYEYIIRECGKTVPDVQTGKFGAEMEVSLVNDGPFTILLDSETL